MPELSLSPWKRRRLLPWVSALAVSASALGVSGCGTLVGSASEAQVRFVDASVDAPALDVYLNGAGAAYNLGFATFSSYLPVSAGNYQFSANRASTTQALATGRGALVAGHQYTAVVGDRLSDLQEHIYPDAVPAAVPGTVAVRILNEVEGGPLDVYLVTSAGLLASGTPLVTNFGFGAGSGYLHVPAGASYLVYVAPAGSSPLAPGVTKVSGSSVSGGSGTARTLILAEAATKENKGLYGIVLEDAETP